MELPAEKPLEGKMKFIFTRAHPFYKLPTTAAGDSMTGMHLTCSRKTILQPNAFTFRERHSLDHHGGG